MGTSITLKRGNEELAVTFSPLPFNRRTLAIVERAQANDLSAVIEAVEVSLAIHHGEAEARRIVEDGFLPWPKGAEFGAILAVVMPWIPGGETKQGGTGV